MCCINVTPLFVGGMNVRNPSSSGCHRLSLFSEAIDGKWVDVKRATPQDGSAPLPTTSTPVPSDADGGVAGASPERQNFREMPSQPGGVTSPEPKFKVPSPGGAGASPDRGFDQTAQQGATNGAGATSNFTSVPPPAM